MTRPAKNIPLVLLALMVGCDTMPQAPTVTALPGTDKSIDEFRTDDVDCRQYADGQAGKAMSAPAVDVNGLTSALLGTAVCGAPNIALADRNRLPAAEWDPRSTGRIRPNLPAMDGSSNITALTSNTCTPGR